MQEFRDIVLEDKGLFDKYLKPFSPQVSELTFTNLFMWRYYYRFKFAEVSGLLCIIAVPKEGLPYAFFPVGTIHGDNFKNALSVIHRYFQEKGWRLEFKKVSEDQIQYFHGFTPEEQIVVDGDNFDYVYLSKDLIHLHGKKLDGKRNHINKFKKLYEYQYVSFSEENLEDCYRIMEEWCEEKNCKIRAELYNEKLATLELLNNFHVLDCKGALIKVDGVFQAFTIGEMLNKDTAVIHLEKANIHINGLYPFVNQQFCQHEWQEATYINREQDLGIEGLRKAKLSYNPYKMIKKYVVYID